MAKNDNPFAIRKSPVSIITVQAPLACVQEHQS